MHDVKIIDFFFPFHSFITFKIHVWLTERFTYSFISLFFSCVSMRKFRFFLCREHWTHNEENIEMKIQKKKIFKTFSFKCIIFFFLFNFATLVPCIYILIHAGSGCWLLVIDFHFDICMRHVQHNINSRSYNSGFHALLNTIHIIQLLHRDDGKRRRRRRRCFGFFGRCSLFGSGIILGKWQ